MPGAPLGPGIYIEGGIRAAYETMGDLIDEDLETAVAWAYADDKTAAAVLLAECIGVLRDDVFLRDHRIQQLMAALETNGIAVPAEDDPNSIL